MMQRTLRRIEQNDETLKELRMGQFGGVEDIDGLYGSIDFSRLGASIGENTHLTTLKVRVTDVTANDDFFQGLKQNSSIHDLQLFCEYYGIVAGTIGEVVEEILKACQANKNLTRLHINKIGGDKTIIATILTRFTNLTRISLVNNGITDQVLIQIVDAIRAGHINSLERLILVDNRIGVHGNAGCETLATLLQDPNCNLQILDLEDNAIDNVGAATLANGLANNTKMRILDLEDNPIDSGVRDIFSRLLCNTSSINSIYSSNHTLEQLTLDISRGDELRFLLKQNRGTNKRHAAIKKILTYHPRIDMVPFFEWNMEGEGERNLKALPYVIAWFERAERASIAEEDGEVSNNDDDSSASSYHNDEESYNIDERKLDTIYQFAQAMPLLFVPASHIKGGESNKNIKRKRDD